MTVRHDRSAPPVGSERSLADGAAGPPALQPTPIVRAPGPRELDPVRYHRRRRFLETALAVSTPLVLLLVWELTAQAGYIDDRYFPAPTTIWDAGSDAVDDGTLLTAVGVTMRKAVAGFVLGALVGVATGVVLGTFRLLRVAVDPVLVALYTIPKLSLLPVLLLIFGLNDMPQVILVAMTVFFLMALSTTAALLSVDEGYIDTARSLLANRRQLYRYVYLPGAMPQIGNALRISAGMCMLVVIGVEFLLGGDGLGHMIWNSWQLFAPERMYAGIVVVGLLGVAFTGVVTKLVRLLAPWSETGELVRA